MFWLVSLRGKYDLGVSIYVKNLTEFKSEGDERSDGYRLARAFVEAGINVSQEIFVGLYQKLYK